MLKTHFAHIPTVLSLFKKTKNKSNTVYFAAASSCPDGLFKCMSGECLSSELVCDFKKDCKDGSDELYCGKPCALTWFWKLPKRKTVFPIQPFKAHAILRITRVVGTTPRRMLGPGSGQTSPRYLDRIIPQGAHGVKSVPIVQLFSVFFRFLLIYRFVFFLQQGMSCILMANRPVIFFLWQFWNIPLTKRQP